MYCCTCAVSLSSLQNEDEKGHAHHRSLPCCDRVVCSACLAANARFETYCPYCQVASPSLSSRDEKQGAKDVLPPGLKAPPPYLYSPASASEDPPPYTETPGIATAEKSIVHYLDHARDSVMSLSLAYGVPADSIRRANNLAADYLLQARRVIQIPSTSTTARTVSISPHPVEDEAETRRKAAVRRFMVACKVADYDLATMYLSSACTEGEYNVGAAMQAYEQDMAWERAHPVEAKKMGKQQVRRGLFR